MERTVPRPQLLNCWMRCDSAPATTAAAMSRLFTEKSILGSKRERERSYSGDSSLSTRHVHHDAAGSTARSSAAPSLPV